MGLELEGPGLPRSEVYRQGKPPKAVTHLLDE